MPVFRNPLLSTESADPFLTWQNGAYYLAVTRGSYIAFHSAPTLAGLAAAPEIVVWRDENPARFTDMWAPEWVFLDGFWWCYYTASDGLGRHRAYVLQSEGADIRGPYRFKTQLLTDARDEFYAIDFGVTQTPSGLLGAWAGHPNHHIYISRLENPYTLSGERILLPTFGFGCEKIHEGPFFLRRNGRIFLIYSVCDARDINYKLGMMWADENSDLLAVSSWQQHPTPVFEKNEAAGVYGPGHCAFFRSPDGTQDWIAYHAKTSTAWTYDDRVACAQPFGWNADGFPDFGVPLELGTELDEPSSLR